MITCGPDHPISCVIPVLLAGFAVFCLVVTAAILILARAG